MRKLISSRKILENCPEVFIRTARKFNLKIYKIVWDEEEGINKNHHMYKYTQYSVRPYKLTYGCDGTTDNNIHLIALHVCNYYNINYLKAYNNAYKERGKQDFLEFKKYIQYIQKDSFLKETTVFPSVINEEVVNQIIHDLYEINYQSFASHLIEIFLEKNIDASLFWEKVKKYQHQ